MEDKQVLLWIAGTVIVLMLYITQCSGGGGTTNYPQGARQDAIELRDSIDDDPYNMGRP